MKILIITILGLAACDKLSAATCDSAACVIDTVDPDDIKAAVYYVGPCYRAGYEICHRFEYCTGALVSPEACIEWWLDNVCLAAPFDPDQMNGCGAWGQQVACDYFYDPSFYPNPQTCPELWPHPLGGVENYEDPVPPGA